MAQFDKCHDPSGILGVPLMEVLLVTVLGESRKTVICIRGGIIFEAKEKSWKMNDMDPVDMLPDLYEIYTHVSQANSPKFHVSTILLRQFSCH